MQINWPPGPQNPQLASGTVHVWAAALDAGPERLAACARLLAADERERAGRFHFARDRDAYIAGRGMLRLLIGRYLARAPETLDISYSDYGKPCLAGGELRFNLAHSAGLALYAFAAHTELGVDVEAERDLPDALPIARRFFSAAEYDALRALPPDEQPAAFFRCWTRKEAFIKAVGEGLSYPLDRFQVSLRPDQAPALLSVDGHAPGAREWTLVDLPLPAAYTGALAFKGRIDRLQKWRPAGW